MVDCGGGTVDITSHVISAGGAGDFKPLCLNELAPPVGGDWGSTKVDALFIEKFVRPLLGENLFDKFMRSGSARHTLLQVIGTHIRGFCFFAFLFLFNA